MYRHSPILAATAAMVFLGQTPSRFAHGDEPFKTAGIVGKVVDETGQPVANATVTVLSARESPLATTAADGTFQLPSPGPESEKNTGYLLAKGPTGTLGFQSATPLKGSPIRIVLREPHHVMVEVTDGKGQPVAGAKTLVTTFFSTVAIGQTDANGKSSLAVPVEVLSYCQVLALKDKAGFDYRISRRRVPFLPIGELKNPVQLTLAGARTVRVRTIDRAGEPIVGVPIVPKHIQTKGQDDYANLSGIAEDEENVEIVVRPVTSAIVRLVDLNGKPLRNVEVSYGIVIPLHGEKYAVITVAFGGNATADGEGRTLIAKLVPGEEYRLGLQVGHSERQVLVFTPKDAKPVDLGQVRVDPELPKPYVPPTPAERTAKSFAQTPTLSPIERKNKVLVEARREYTRPLLLFGWSDDPACVDLFRLFNEESESRPDSKDAIHTPASLRWEFELASLDLGQPDVQKLAQSLGLDIAKRETPVLAILNADGVLAATYPLVFGDKKTLDGKALAAFLLSHKLPTRDAERMLADALKKAAAEDKRVWFIASASWCPPCRLLSRYLDPWKKELEEHFVFVKLDISRDEHAREVRDRIQQDRDGGVPWFAILDPQGKVLATSNAPSRQREGKDANIGFPTGEAEIEHFMLMIAQNAPRLSNAQLTRMRAAFDSKK